MKKGYITMSEEEKKRDRILVQVQEGYSTLKEASKKLGVSYRQTKRIWKRYKREGVKGLLHRGRGIPGQGYGKSYREGILRRYQEEYYDFGPTFAMEKLGQEGYKNSHETLRLWLLSEGIWTRKRKRNKY